MAVSTGDIVKWLPGLHIEGDPDVVCTKHRRNLINAEGDYPHFVPLLRGVGYTTTGFTSEKTSYPEEIEDALGVHTIRRNVVAPILWDIDLSMWQCPEDEDDSCHLHHRVMLEVPNE
jgi:hypothetical protein